MRLRTVSYTHLDVYKRQVLGDLWNKFDACLDQNYLAVIEHFKKLKKLAD